MFSSAPCRTPIRCVLAAGMLLTIGAVALDTTRPLERQRTTSLALAVVHAHQQFISPYLTAIGVRCRFTPTCSRYAEAAVRRYGAAGGSWRILRRIARCGPWTPPGTSDPL